MRSYDQYCSLEVAGDRWTLLVVRGLLVRPCRYADLQASLPGIATSLLAAEHGVTTLGDARNLDRLRQPDWLGGPVAS
jgi:HxlR-like helix-turn-helix